MVMSEQQAVIEAPPKESFLAVLAVGIAAMLAGAALWALVTVLTQSELGLMAIAVGFMVGFGIQKFRKRPDRRFGILGAVLALLGCVLGNVFSLEILLAQKYGVPLEQALSRIDIALVAQLLTAGFHPMDLLFYAIAVYEGYKFSSR